MDSLFNYGNLRDKQFTWEPPLDPPQKKCYCKKCGQELQRNNFGQIKRCSHGEEVEYDF
jgi:hypothetical protein